MSEGISIFADNVVLEVSEVIGTEDLTTQVQTGTTTNTHTTSTPCQPKENAVDQAYNSPYQHVYNKYSGSYHNVWFTIGDLGQGCDMSACMDIGGNFWYTPINKLLYINLGVNSGNVIDNSGNATADNPEFERIPPVAWPNSNSPLKPYNGQDWDYNVQGRSIYFLERNTSQPRGYTFDVVDNYGRDILVLKANGEDNASDMFNAIPLLNDDYSSQELDWYVSAWQHMINWDTSRDIFTWTNQAETINQSYEGNSGFSTSGGYPQSVSECFENPGYLGLRSNYFHYDYTEYEVEIDVASIHNARITVFDDSGGSNPGITTTGVHTFCIDLRMSEFWGGTSNISSGGVGIDGSPSGTTSQFFDVFEGGITLLNAEAIDGNSAASVMINDIKITKLETTTTTTTTTTPVYTTTTFGQKDIHSWEYLDVLESESVPFSLTFNVGDLRDMSKRATGFSKTFNIPASQHNCKVLSPMLAVGNERNAIDIDKGNPYISWHKARVKSNGIYVFHGLMRVEEGNTGQGGYFKCHLLEDHIDWTLEVGKKSICDIDLFDGKTHSENKSRANILASWDNSPDNGDTYFWGLVNYGQWWAQQINSGSSWDYDHSNNDFHPMVFAKAIVDRIFGDAGYILESNFLNSQTFKQLCHPYSSGESYFEGEGDNFGENASNACHVELPGYHTTYNKGSFCSHGIHYPCMTCSSNWAYWYPAGLVPGSDPGNNWSTNSASGGYTVPFTGMYHISWVATLYNKHGGFGRSCIGIRIKKNGGTIGSISSTINSSGNSMSCWNCTAGWSSGSQNGQTKDMDGDVFLQAGDNISLQVFGANGLWLFHAYTKVEDIKLDIYPIASSTVPALPVSLNTDKLLPCTKQIDYIKGITEMFNLQWTTDNEKKVVYCEPYDDFFGSGKILDWSDKLDYTSWNDKYIVEELAKKITFKYKRDTSDDIVESVYTYREFHEQPIYKSHVEENDQKFRKEELEMGTKVFSSTIQFNSYGSQPNPPQNSDGHYNWGDLTWTNPASNSDNPLMPIMWQEDGGAINRQSRPDYNDKPRFDLRILNYYGKAECARWRWVDENANKHNHDKYPHLGWKDCWLKNQAPDPYSLHWGDESDSYGNDSPGLFTKYWRNAYLKMNGGSALRTCMMKLTPVDIAIFDYRDLIYLKIDDVATYWTVNKIIDYKPNQQVLTKVELVEWKQSVDFAQSRSGASGSRSSRLANPSEALDGENKMLSRKSRVNYLQNKDKEEEQQTILGKYHQSSSTDVLQVGAGKNHRDRTTALSVSKEGEVQIHGGELAVEETDGIIHDLVYTTPEGEIKKVYLKKKDSDESDSNKEESTY